MAADSRMVSIAVVVAIIIVHLVFTNFLIGSQVYYLVLDKYPFIFLISRLRSAQFAMWLDFVNPLAPEFFFKY
jgi:hypothetical protein